MAFKRTDLAGLGIEPDKIQILIDWHMETVKGLQAKIDESKDNSDELAKVQAELEKAKNSLKEANDKLSTAEKDDYKGKYESAAQEIEKLKSEYAAKETVAAQKKALRSFLKNDSKAWEDKFSDSAINLICNKGNLHESIELDDNGNIKNADKIKSAIESDGDFSGFIPHVTVTSATLATPPANTGGKKAMTWEDIDKISDNEQAIEAIARNFETLGIK